MGTENQPQLVVLVRKEGVRYEVMSGRNTYTIKDEGSGDAMDDVLSLWSWDCPASKYHEGLCKHIDAVVDFIDRAEQEVIEDSERRID